jgi:hypothetical protein
LNPNEEAIMFAGNLWRAMSYDITESL